MPTIPSFTSEQDKEKFQYLYDHYKKLLLYKAYSILKDYGLAETAVTQAYVQIYRNLDKIEDPASNEAVALAVTVVKNAAYALGPKKDTLEENPINLENYILTEAKDENIHTLLDSLPENLRAMLLFKYAYGFSHKEIGQLLNTSENAAAVLYQRARQRLMALLKKEGYASEKKQTYK